MFLVANLLFAVAQVLDYVLWAYIWIIMARVVVSIANADTSIPVVRFIFNATEPVFRWVRQRVSLVIGNFDLTPIVVWIAAVFLQRFVVHTLYDLASRMH